MSIKSRKLFAILVITLMILTMLPLTAFAADTSWSATNSFVTVDKTSAIVNSPIVFTLNVLDANLAAVTTGPVTFWLKSSRDAETGTVAAAAVTPSAINPVTAGSAEGQQFVVTPAAEGKVTVTLTSAAPGNVTIGFYRGGAKDGVLIDSKTVTFRATAVTLDTVTVTVTPSTSADVGTELTLAAQLNPALRDKEVTFSKSYKGGSYVTIGTATTNILGRATIKVTETASGAYTFRATAEGVSGTAAFTYNALAPIRVEKVTADGTNVAVARDFRVKAQAFDPHGNLKLDVNALDFKVQKAPSDSALKDAVLAKAVDTADDTVYGTFRADVAGEYTIRAYVVGNTSIFKDIVLQAVPFGTLTEVKVMLASGRSSLRSVDKTTPDAMTLRVQIVDNNGVAVSTTDYAGIKLYSSNPALVKVTGDFNIEGPNVIDRVGTAVISAVHLASGITGTVNVPVVGGPAAITSNVSYDGLKASVTLQAVDAAGNPTYWGTVGTGTAIGYNILAPNVTVSNKKDFGALTGKATFDATVSAAGTFNVTIVTANGFSKAFTLDYVPPKPELGAVVMFIGSNSYVADGKPGTMDVAPFIENGRTFVPVRFVAEAFGCVADWGPKDAATEWVTLTRGDMVITITIGSAAIVVVSGGFTETVTADVAAFIKDGRTFLPLRAIGEIFGAEFDWGPKDAATEWVSFS